MALEILIPNTGQGDCSFIRLPNGNNMIIDFNRTDEDVDILALLRAKIPKRKHEDIGKTCRRINFFVNTHPHNDHLKGISALDGDEFYIDEIWESNHRLYVPADQSEDYKNYYDFLTLVRKLKKRGAVKVCKAGRTPVSIGSTGVYFFAPSAYVADSRSRAEIHAQCVVLKVQYRKNSILFTGDSDRESWEKRIVPNYSDDKEVDGKKQENLLGATVLHASHHGSKYFLVTEGDEEDRYTRSMDKIKPRFTVISVGADNKHGHPDPLAISIYRDKTERRRVYSTKDNRSMYFAFKNDGKVEYRAGLEFDELLDMKHSEETIGAAAATLTFNLDRAIELELPKRPPKPKREGYFEEIHG